MGKPEATTEREGSTGRSAANPGSAGDIRAVTVGCIVLVLFAGTFWLNRPSASDAPTARRVQLKPRNLSFGEVWSQRDFVWTIDVQNNSPDAIRIVKIGTTCECTSATPQALSVSPGESRPIQLTLNLPNPPQVPREPFRVTIIPTIEANGSRESLYWEVSGVVRSVAAASPSEVHLGEKSTLAPPFEPVNVRLRFHLPVQKLHASCNTPLASASISPIEGRPGEFDLQIVPGDLPLGRVEFSAIVGGMDHDGVGLPPLEIPVSGVVLPDISASPPSLMLGVREIGASAEGEFVLRSRTGGSFEIEGLSFDSDLVHVEALEPTSPRRARFQASQVVSGTGVNSTPVTFSVRRNDGALETLEVRVINIGTTGP